MTQKEKAVTSEMKVKTFRWLFLISLAQVLAFFIVPVFVLSAKYLLYLELLAALTLGLIFGLFFLGVNVYGLFVDRSRRVLYISFITVIGLWIGWAVVSWSYIEYMDYLLR